MAGPYLTLTLEDLVNAAMKLQKAWRAKQAHPQRMVSDGCQMGVRWVSDGYRELSRLARSLWCQMDVRWVSDECHMGVRWVPDGC